MFWHESAGAATGGWEDWTEKAEYLKSAGGVGGFEIYLAKSYEKEFEDKAEIDGELKQNEGGGGIECMIKM